MMVHNIGCQVTVHMNSLCIYDFVFVIQEKKNLFYNITKDNKPLTAR